MDEGSAGVAKDALHNFKLDGENKIKVRTVAFLRFSFVVVRANDILYTLDHVCQEVKSTSLSAKRGVMHPR